MTHRIQWIDGKAEPKNPPNPRYPLGIDLDMSKGADRSCQVTLPYPAKRIGYYDVECTDCGIRVAISTAGRADDPRSAKIACKGAR
jgi:hypothetical protein